MTDNYEPELDTRPKRPCPWCEAETYPHPTDTDAPLACGRSSCMVKEINMLKRCLRHQEEGVNYGQAAPPKRRPLDHKRAEKIASRYAACTTCAEREQVKLEATQDLSTETFEVLILMASVAVTNGVWLLSLEE